jgi:predicted ATPase
MQLIHKITIRYFRSVYTASLSHCASLNIISGRNDAGKSNVLRALNLFFNGRTDWHNQLDFYKDISVHRLEEVRKESIKGRQFISITIEFIRPDNYKGSLPQIFSVTRSWFRETPSYIESNNLEALQKRGKLPKGLETAQRFLPIFLNRIYYEYVPAVKDRAYFSDLLSRLQATLLGIPLDSDADISTVAENLARHIQGRVVALQDDFMRATGLNSEIEPPKEFASLFQAFQVSTKSGNEQIPLIARGDGIQARYVPSVLNYITSNSRKFFIWGFEEPENSLEYRHADALAEDFKRVYSKKAQTFITTHSPAFVSLVNQDIACYRAFQDDDKTQIVLVSDMEKNSAHKEKLREEIGILKIQEEVHQQYTNKLAEFDNLQKQNDQLKKEASLHGRPLVLVEGKTDMQILDVAWKKLNPGVQANFIVRVADPSLNVAGTSAGGARSVARTIESIHPDDDRPAVGLFDNDAEGLKAFRNLSKNFKKYRGLEDIKRHINGLAFAIVLPVPAYRTEYAKSENHTMEFMFRDHVLVMQTADMQGLVLERPPITGVQLGSKQMHLNGLLAGNIENVLGNLDAYRKISSGKDAFAEQIVPTLDSGEFDSFRELFQRVDTVLAAV